MPRPATHQSTRTPVRATAPASDEQWLVSVNGGSVPRWSAERLRLGLPQPLFDVPRSIVGFAGMQGDRFLFQGPDGAGAERIIEIVVNWEKLLER